MGPPPSRRPTHQIPHPTVTPKPAIAKRLARIPQVVASRWVGRGPRGPLTQFRSVVSFTPNRRATDARESSLDNANCTASRRNSSGTSMDGPTRAPSSSLTVRIRCPPDRVDSSDFAYACRPRPACRRHVGRDCGSLAEAAAGWTVEGPFSFGQDGNSVCTEDGAQRITRTALPRAFVVLPGRALDRETRARHLRLENEEGRCLFDQVSGHLARSG